MKSTVTSFLLAFFCFLGKSIACDCLPVVDFCQSITDDNNGEIYDYLNIYYVTVAVKESNGMKVAIHKTYHGEELTGHSIFITDGDGANCQIFTNQFTVGEQLIIAASKLTDIWSISECGTNFLKVENDQVIGQITPTISQMPLSEFSSLNGCGDLNPLPTNEPQGPLPVLVQPTLAYDQVTIKTNGFASTDFELKVFDAIGRLVHQATLPKEQVAFYGTRIPVGDWGAGLYFFKIKGANRDETFKIVKMDNQ